jgi:hypothetical protein
VSTPSPDDGNRSSFRNVVLYFLGYQIMEKVQKLSNRDIYAFVKSKAQNKILVPYSVAI